MGNRLVSQFNTGLSASMKHAVKTILSTCSLTLVLSVSSVAYSFADALFDSLDTHERIQVAYLEYRITQSQLEEVRRSWFPTLSADISSFRERTSVGSSVSYDSIFEAEFNAELTVWEYYGLQDRVDRARVETMITSFSIEVEQFNLWSSLSILKAEHKRLSKLLDAQNKARQRLRSAQNAVSVKLEQGNATELDEDIVRDAILLLEEQQSQTLFDLDSIENRFAVLSGNQNIKDYVREPKGSLDFFMEEMLTRNPQIQRAKLARLLTEAERKRLRSQRLPVLSVYGRGTVTRLGTSNTTRTSGEVGVKLSVPFSFNPVDIQKDRTEGLRLQRDTTSLALEYRNGADVLKEFDRKRSRSTQQLATLDKLLSRKIGRFPSTLDAYSSGELNVSIADVTADVTDILSTYNSMLTVQKSLDESYVSVWAQIGRTP